MGMALKEPATAQVATVNEVISYQSFPGQKFTQVPFVKDMAERQCRCLKVACKKTFYWDTEALKVYLKGDVQEFSLKITLH